jgi:fimbrial chaperone protein
VSAEAKNKTSEGERNMMRVERAWRTLALCALAGLFGPLAWSGSFQVNPIRVDLSGRAQTSALTVRNTGDEPVVVQVSVEAWSQDESKDVYAPTRELLATPPVMTIPPNEERIVRVGMRRAPDRNRELSYRLFLQEVPPPPKPGFQGLVVALRVGLPVFIAPAQGTASPRMTWKAARLPDNKIEVTAANGGTAHLQVADFTLMASDTGNTVATYSGLTYVLPDQRRQWTLPLTAPLGASRIRVKAVTDAGNLDADIDLPN